MSLRTYHSIDGQNSNRTTREVRLDSSLTAIIDILLLLRYLNEIQSRYFRYPYLPTYNAERDERPEKADADISEIMLLPRLLCMISHLKYFQWLCLIGSIIIKDLDS